MAPPSKKILIDNNLSVLLKDFIAISFPGSQPVADLNMTQRADSELWQWAKDNNYLILSKDKDFYHRISLLGPPPQVIWIKRGNCRNREMIQLVRDHLSVMAEFANSPEGLLIIT